MKFAFFLLAVTVFNINSNAQNVSDYSSKELVYGRKDGAALTLMKVTPNENKKGKAIISVVSGNWNSNYSMLVRYMERSIYLVENGYTVFFVMHASQPRFSIDEQVNDLKRAVRFVRYNAKEYGIDADHIGISGASSGGHLSLMTALNNDSIKFSADPVDKLSSRVQAAAVFFPPTDFLNWGSDNTNINFKLLKQRGVAGAFDFKYFSDSTGMYEHVADQNLIKQIVAKYSPVNNVSSDDPPVLILHGDADPVVPLQQSKNLIKKLNDAGVKNELIIKPEGKHGWKNDPAEEAKIIAWFDAYLK